METQEPQTQNPAGSTKAAPTTEPFSRTMPSWLSDYLKNNPVTVAWQSALVIGAFILAIHFLFKRKTWVNKVHHFAGRNRRDHV